jgi:hypothetical protein
MTGVLLFSLIGGLISRWHGGGFFPAPKALKNVVWAAPFAVAAFLFTGNVPLSILALVLCVAGKAIAHGIYIDLGRWKGGKGYWHDFAGLTAVGFLAVYGAVIAFVLMGFLVPALIISIGGLLKGAAYEIGWSIYPQGTGKGIPWLNEATAIGEFLTGVAAYAALGIGVQLI